MAHADAVERALGGAVGGALAEPLLRKRRAGAGILAEARTAAIGRLAVPLAVVTYVATGVTQPLAMSAVKFAGLGDTTCQLYMLPYYAGMACVGLLAPPARWGALPLHRCALVALVGIVAQSLNYTGNMLCGSGTFSVIYASAPIWNAAFARLLLQRALTARQSAAVLAVFLGLVVANAGARGDGGRASEGACLVGVGVALHALCHVLTEKVSVRGSKVPAQINCCVQGLTACAVVGAWQCIYTLPHSERIAGPASDAGTTYARAWMLMLTLAAGNFVHAGTFFYLLTALGSVSVAVLKGAQAATVFCVAHFMYCHRDASQCITPTKGASLAVVVAGVLAYAAATRAAGAGAAGPPAGGKRR